MPAVNLIVTDIRQTKRGRFSVYLEEEFFCALHEEIFLTSGLQPNMSVTAEQMEELRARSDYRIATERALRLLSGRSYTEQGLYGKLCEKVAEEQAAAVVARMVELGLLDDADYARRYAADCINLKGFSLRRTELELRRKGISKEIAESVLQERQDDPQAAIARVVRRKYLRCISDEKGFVRATNALFRLGYRPSDIRAVLQNLLEDVDYYEG